MDSMGIHGDGVTYIVFDSVQMGVCGVLHVLKVKCFLKVLLKWFYYCLYKIFLSLDSWVLHVGIRAQLE